VEQKILEQMLNEGLSLEAMGRQAGLHPSTVSYWLRQYGLQPAGHARHAPRGALPREQLERLVADHLTVREIAQAVGRSPTTVRHWLRRYGLETTQRARTKTRTNFARPPLEADCAKHGRAVFIQPKTGGPVCARCRADAVVEWRRRAKRLLVEEAGGACAACGFDSYVGALHFHHIDPSLKRFGIGGRGLAHSIETLREEARKCVLLCSNCHAQVEAGVLALP
jgi:transposase-like protein